MDVGKSGCGSVETELEIPSVVVTGAILLVLLENSTRQQREETAVPR
jgi:hypothetical protein